MANRLLNEELRNSLREYGEDVGPITPTTRSTYERRLLSLRKTRGLIKNSGAPLNAFSSDDSELENASSNVARKKRTLTRSDSGERSERLSLIRSRETNSSPDSDIFKKPLAIPSPVLSQEKKIHQRTQNHSRKVKKNVTRNAAFDVETSDSDFDAESPYSKTPRLKRKPLASNFSTDLHGVSLRRTTDETVSYNSIFQRKSLNSTWSPESDQSLSRFGPISEKLKRDHNNQSFQSNGYISNSNGEFPEEKVLQGSSTNYSHWVSWLLLIGAVAFFAAIGLVYMSGVYKTTQTIDRNYLKFCNGVKEDQCNSLILMSRELHYLLSAVAGYYECGSIKSRNVTVAYARETMRDLMRSDKSFKMANFDSIFNRSVRFFKENPKLGVRCHASVEEASLLLLSGSSTSIEDGISALEAVKAAKSFWCRIRLSIAWTATKLLLLLLAGCFLFILYLGGNFWKRRRESQEKLFFEMVEKVIDILQDPMDSFNQSNPLSGACKAVVNVRDTLIPAKERKRKLWLWDRVVAFIEENESRVSVEYQKINGEDFKVWRWHPCTTPESEGGKQGKVWQGQAFSSLGKGKLASYTPSRCLKIRNMFDPEVEYGNDWQVNIRDAILEKCERNEGVVHIAFDTLTNNEGCVFMMCSSEEAAGKAYNDLHGWWFDGKLVTAKYLKLTRYLERFPEAERCTEPLKPSNNKRLSLSTPFFSSALERS